MSHYKNNASNRDALFGPSSGGGSKKASGGPRHKQDAAANREALFGGSSSKPSGGSRVVSLPKPPPPPSSSSHSKASASSSSSGLATSRSKAPKKKSSYGKVLSGPAKAEKMKEAQDYRDKAKKAMSRGMFSRPDPIAAGNFYKRAADIYKQCGENKLERLHRIASADSQMGQDAYATAASEYTRAAELCQEATDEPAEKRRAESSRIYREAANAWTQMGEKGKAGLAHVKAAQALLLDNDDNFMGKQALKALEAAVEAHVPDPLNRYAKHRQGGEISAFVDPNSSLEPDREMLRQHVVTTSYAHENVQQVVYTFVEYGEYASALYAAGAVTYMLELDDFATISVSRAYIVETILQLAMGDVVAADQTYINKHLQRTSYLQSRECKLAEDLIRAIQRRDYEALEEAKEERGNRNALANMDPKMRDVVMNQLKLSGGASKKKHHTPKGGTNAPGGPPPASREAAPKKSALELSQKAQKVQESLEDNLAEMDDLMDNLDILGDEDFGGSGTAAGGGGNDNSDAQPYEPEEEELSDDEIDLR